MPAGRHTCSATTRRARSCGATPRHPRPPTWIESGHGQSRLHPPAEAIAGISRRNVALGRRVRALRHPLACSSRRSTTPASPTSRPSRTTAASTTGASGILLRDKRIRRMVASYVGENKEFERQYLSGELEVELTPQGTLAERLRAGGSGIRRLLHRDRRRHPGRRGRAALAVRRRTATSRSPRPPKETQDFESTGETRSSSSSRRSSPTSAWCGPAKGDRHGNLVFHQSARNFNPLVRDGRPGHDRRGRGARRARRARPRPGPPARHLRAAGAAADPRAGRGQADRAPHRPSPRRRRPPTEQEA